jgi:hypothetical protein
MSRKLNEAVLECVQATAGTMDDHGQRSALGLARSWAEKREPIVRTAANGLRDDLAIALTVVLADSNLSECKVALGAARRWVNAPFVDPTMNGQGARRPALEKPGASKGSKDEHG